MERAVVEDDGFTVVALGPNQPGACDRLPHSALFERSRQRPVTVSDIDPVWQQGPVSVTLTADDTLSGVDATYYRIDGGQTVTYTAPFDVTGDGTHTVEYWSRELDLDIVGLKEEIDHLIAVHHHAVDFLDFTAASLAASTADCRASGSSATAMTPTGKWSSTSECVAPLLFTDPAASKSTANVNGTPLMSPAATPLTAQTTGLGRFMMLLINGL